MTTVLGWLLANTLVVARYADRYRRFRRSRRAVGARKGPVWEGAHRG